MLILAVVIAILGELGNLSDMDKKLYGMNNSADMMARGSTLDL